MSSSWPEKISVVRGHVERAVARQVEQDHALLAGLARGLGLVEDGADRARRLGTGQDRLGAGEPDGGLERRVLLVRARLHHAGLDEARDERRVAVVAQAAGVHRRRHEVVAERVHGEERGHADGVAEVVAVAAAGECWAGRRLGGDEAHLRLAAEHAAHEGERQPGEVRAAPDAADHDIRLVARQLHLLQRLLPDHGLVQADVVEHRAERVVRLRVARRDLHRLRDRDAESEPDWCSAMARPASGGVARGAVDGRAQASISERRYGFWS